MPVSLVKIADVLTNYARGGAPGSIPKVHINFTVDPTDIEVDGWALKLVLEGFDKIDDHGEVVSNYEKAWEVTGPNPEECLERASKVLADFLRSQLYVKMSETQAVEDALKNLENKGSEGELPALWPSNTLQAKALEAQEEEGGGWSQPLESDPI